MYMICLHNAEYKFILLHFTIIVPTRRHHIRPVEKNLPVPLQKDCQPPVLISGNSSSPSQLIRTLVCFPPIESSSMGSSGDPPLLSLPLRHFPVCGRSPTKYARVPRTSETGAVHSSSARENVIRSWVVRMVIGPRKHRGSETEMSPKLARRSTSRDGRPRVLPSRQERSCWCFIFQNEG